MPAFFLNLTSPALFLEEPLCSGFMLVFKGPNLGINLTDMIKALSTLITRRYKFSVWEWEEEAETVHGKLLFEWFLLGRVKYKEKRKKFIDPGKRLIAWKNSTGA